MHRNQTKRIDYKTVPQSSHIEAHNPAENWVKRSFDIIFSLLVVLLLLWWITIIIAVITKITMPGPVFFRQRRTGYLGREFVIYKFRTMVVNDTADDIQASAGDPRITRWGSIMRRTHIDELPQFINVLAGDMSVIGPRPHMLKHTEQYSVLIDNYMMRHRVRPGITGWAQVNGACGETRDISKMQERIRLDLWYINNWSLKLDRKIFWKTLAR